MMINSGYNYSRRLEGSERGKEKIKFAKRRSEDCGNEEWKKNCNVHYLRVHSCPTSSRSRICLSFSISRFAFFCCFPDLKKKKKKIPHPFTHLNDFVFSFLFLFFNEITHEIRRKIYMI